MARRLLSDRGSELQCCSGSVTRLSAPGVRRHDRSTRSRCQSGSCECEKSQLIHERGRRCDLLFVRVLPLHWFSGLFLQPIALRALLYEERFIREFPERCTPCLKLKVLSLPSH